MTLTAGLLLRQAEVIVVIGAKTRSGADSDGQLCEGAGGERRKGTCQ